MIHQLYPCSKHGGIIFYVAEMIHQITQLPYAIRYNLSMDVQKTDWWLFHLSGNLLGPDFSAIFERDVCDSLRKIFKHPHSQ